MLYQVGAWIALNVPLSNTPYVNSLAFNHMFIIVYLAPAYAKALSDYSTFHKTFIVHKYAIPRHCFCFPLPFYTSSNFPRWPFLIVSSLPLSGVIFSQQFLYFANPTGWLGTFPQVFLSFNLESSLKRMSRPSVHSSQIPYLLSGRGYQYASDHSHQTTLSSTSTATAPTKAPPKKPMSSFWETVLDTSFEAGSSSNSHVLTQHCPMCHRAFNSTRAFNEHVQARACSAYERSSQQPQSEKPHVCNECGTAFKKNSNLVKHKKLVHLGERNFKCPEPSCGRLFGQKSNLNSHIKAVHLGEKPFTCNEPGCGRCFSQKSGLKAHVKTVHNGERPYVCECGSSFGHRGDVCVSNSLHWAMLIVIVMLSHLSNISNSYFRHFFFFCSWIVISVFSTSDSVPMNVQYAQSPERSVESLC